MIEVKCEVCGKVVRRSPSKVHNHVFCSHECWKTMASAMWTKDQRDAVRRREKKNKGDCKAGTYPKFHGRHEHRVVAERMLGRPLRPGEVVHHINGDSRDNRPENLMVFGSNREHIEYHAAHPEEKGEHTLKGRFAPDPREVYREFLDAWLDWIEKGSRRDKEGNPKLPKKKGAAA